MRHPIMAIAVALLAGPVAGAPQGMPHWGTVSGWEILVDTGADRSCLMERAAEGGLVLRFGLVPGDNAAFFDVLSPDWTMIADGQPAPIALSFGDAPYDGAVTGRTEGDLFGARAALASVQDATELAGRPSVSVQHPDGAVLILPLFGTVEAMRALQDCQMAQTEG